ncbi:hypothetical protein [Ralstonia insidiosa]|uniref:hypothetical protein n=1 Tax=Ralstonia insidiosa TaxID=190721 RepID=UPI001FD87047|nr:hypothetical protein [Ralstonia insidiosa]
MSSGGAASGVAPSVAKIASCCAAFWLSCRMAMLESTKKRLYASETARETISAVPARLSASQASNRMTRAGIFMGVVVGLAGVVCCLGRSDLGFGTRSGKVRSGTARMGSSSASR